MDNTFAAHKFIVSIADLIEKVISSQEGMNEADPLTMSVAITAHLANRLTGGVITEGLIDTFVKAIREYPYAERDYEDN